jgi:hypothetical protein
MFLGEIDRVMSEHFRNEVHWAPLLCQPDPVGVSKVVDAEPGRAGSLTCLLPPGGEAVSRPSGERCKSPKVRNAWLAVSLRKRQDHAMVYI